MINTRYYYLYAILILGIVVRGMVSDFVGCYDVFLAVGMPFSKIIFDKRWLNDRVVGRLKCKIGI